MPDLRLLDLSALGWAQVAAFVNLLASLRALQRTPASTSLEAEPKASTSSRGPTPHRGGGKKHPQGAQWVMVRACSGGEPLLEETLGTSGVVQGVAPGGRVVLAVVSREDEAYPVAVRVAEKLRGRGVEASVVETRTGAVNAKSGQLAAVLEGDRAEVVVVADSDVSLGEAEVRSLLEAVQRPGVGAAWVPPAEVLEPRTAGDRLSQALLCGSLHAFPVLCGIDRGGMVGKLFAIRREALDAVGGFGSLSEVLGEDMELGRRLAGAGHGVVAVPGLARSMACGRTVEAVIERYARWLQVIRSQRPALLLSYPLLFFPLLPLLLMAVWAGGAVGWATAALALGGRLLVAVVARWVIQRRAPGLGTLGDIMFADLLLAVSYTKTLLGRTVVWRGRTMSVASGGRLRLVARAALPLALAVLLGASAALALPKLGEQGKNVRLEDADGKVTRMETMLGKPILIVYEDKDSAKLNQGFKDELSKLAKGDKYKSRVALAAVADVADYNYWPVKGFVKDSIRSESKKIGTTIFCDWDGHVRVSYGFRRGTSSIVLLNKSGKVVFASEGKMSADDRKRAIDLLRAEVEGGR